MTEYDYSPEAIESYRRTQDRISNWTNTSAVQAHRFANPNKPTPSEAGRVTEGPGFSSHRSHSRSKSVPPVQVYPQQSSHHHEREHRHHKSRDRDRTSESHSRSSSRKHSQSGRSHHHHSQHSSTIAGAPNIIYQPTPHRSATMPMPMQYATGATSPLRYNGGYTSPPVQVYYPQQYQVQSPTYIVPSYGFPAPSPKKTPLFKRIFSGVFSGSGSSTPSSRKSKRERRSSF